MYSFIPFIRYYLYTQRRSVYAFCPFIHFGAGFENLLPARRDRINVS